MNDEASLGATPGGGALRDDLFAPDSQKDQARHRLAGGLRRTAHAPEGLAASAQSSNDSEHLMGQLIPDDALHTLKRWTTHMDTLTSINVFRQVVESGSFVGAADRLDLSTAMVSKHVMAN